MKPGNGEQLAELLERALALSGEERRGLLRALCDEDADLANEVDSLMTAYQRAPDGLERLAATVLPSTLDSISRGLDARAPLAGLSVGRYEVLRRLGGGGMGEVYQARDPELDRPVALKLLPAHLTADPEARARLKTEARAASALDHPNLAVVHEIGVTEGVPGGAEPERLFIVMAYYAGETLKQKIARGPLPIADAMDHGTQVAEGLAAAHEAGIVHRDIKPANLMLTDSGQIKIVDFGLAKLAGADVTKEGTTLGTVAYMSPEQTRGGTVDARTDIWSLGVVLYEMLAGVRPFRGDSDAVVVHAIRHDEPQPITALRPDVPGSLAAVIRTCLEKDPTGRYASAADLLAGLRGDRARDARGRWSWRGAGRIVLGSAGLALGVAAVSSVVQHRGVMREIGVDRAVVVPFENRTGRAALDPIGSIAADWISQGLAQTGLSDVVPFETSLGSDRSVASVLDTADGLQRLRALASETGANILVSGSYYALGDSLYLQARITDTAAERLLEVIEPVGAPGADPLAGIQEVRQRVIAALAPHVDPRMRDHAAVVGRTPSFDAYREYVEGMERFVVDGDWHGAIQRFARAAAHDSLFMLPLVRAASAFAAVSDYARVDSIARLVEPHLDQLAEYDRQTLIAAAAWARGDYAVSYRAALRGAEVAPNSMLHYQVARELLILNRPRAALAVFDQLDPHRGELSRSIMYWIKLTETHHLLGDYRAELETARRAREVYPGSSNMLRLELRALVALGRVAEALRTLDDYLASPFDGPLWSGQLMIHTGRELAAHGHTDAANQLYARSANWYLALPAAEQDRRRLQLAEALYLAGRWADAEKVLLALAADQPDNLYVQAQLGTVLARQGRRAEAERIAEWLAALDRPYLLGEHTYRRARIAAVLGEQEQALALLQAAFAEGLKWWLFPHHEPDFDSLRDHPSFRELLRPKG